MNNNVITFFFACEFESSFIHSSSVQSRQECDLVLVLQHVVESIQQFPVSVIHQHKNSWSTDVRQHDNGSVCSSVHQNKLETNKPTQQSLTLNPLERKALASL